jgi:NitT/TauT family transport system substrate-binding protein
VLGGGAASTLLGGCGEGHDTGARPVVFLTVQSLDSLTFCPELYADAAGLFAARGLEVEFQAARGSPQAVQLVLADQVTLSRTGQIEIVRHSANNDVPLVVVGTLNKRCSIRYVSSVKDPLLKPQDFPGKLIGLPSTGGESEMVLDLCLKGAGVAAESVMRQVTGVGPATFSLVERGQIAGFAASMDTATILAATNPEAVVFDPSRFTESGTQVYVTTRSRLDEDRAAIAEFLGAVRQATEFVIEDEPSGFRNTLEVIGRKYDFEALRDKSMARQILHAYVGAWTADGRHDVLRTIPERWQYAYEELVAAGLTRSGREPADWFTNDLLP